RAVKLRHQVETRKRDVEAVAQSPADLALDHFLAGEQPQPQPQLALVIVRPLRDLGLGVERHGALIHHISPPAIASVVPVTAASSRDARDTTAEAASSAWIRRPMRVSRSYSAGPSACGRPVLAGTRLM